MSDRLSFTSSLDLDSPIRETDILDAFDEFLNNNSKLMPTSNRQQPRHHSSSAQSPVNNNLSMSRDVDQRPLYSPTSWRDHAARETAADVRSLAPARCEEGRSTAFTQETRDRPDVRREAVEQAVDDGAVAQGTLCRGVDVEHYLIVCTEARPEAGRIDADFPAMHSLVAFYCEKR
ncbi:PREDICTED: uncharacterized protein LOC106821334 [Priapulus caudatus]|uniref:Uncharacterized protein LOC106821334 n=1 Tax=Priapulus caudatus TaxID=37621 RepID=A0ABM1FAV7_PRICU|nr:PREDICTED: uncharacterized protein LOC106821334 [Priapulus caudatus]